MACIRVRRGKPTLDWRDGRGRRRWRSFPNTKEGREAADIALADLHKARRAGLSVDDKITVGEALDEWLAVAGKTVGPGTYYHYKMAAERLRDRFESDRLVTLNAPKLLSFGTELMDGGMAKSTVASILGIVHTFIAHGVLVGNLTGNPAAGLSRVLKLRRKETLNIKAMTEEQLAVFLKAADTLRQQDRVALHLYAHTGLRLSEGLGIRVEDFDTEAAKIRVEYQRLEDRTLARLKTPASRRFVDVPAPLATLITEDLARRREEALCRGWTGPRFVIDWLNQKGVQRAMAAALEVAGLPDHFTVHCLRHTFATLHLVRGAALLWVSRQLGHASVRLTADTYGGWIQPESPGTADAFAERLARKEARLPGPAEVLRLKP